MKKILLRNEDYVYTPEGIRQVKDLSVECILLSLDKKFVSATKVESIEETISGKLIRIFAEDLFLPKKGLIGVYNFNLKVKEVRGIYFNYYIDLITSEFISIYKPQTIILSPVLEFNPPLFEKNYNESFLWLLGLFFRPGVKVKYLKDTLCIRSIGVISEKKLLYKLYFEKIEKYFKEYFGIIPIYRKEIEYNKKNKIALEIYLSYEFNDKLKEFQQYLNNMPDFIWNLCLYDRLIFLEGILDNPNILERYNFDQKLMILFNSCEILTKIDNEDESVFIYSQIHKALRKYYFEKVLLTDKINHISVLPYSDYAKCDVSQFSSLTENSLPNYIIRMSDTTAVCQTIYCDSPILVNAHVRF